MRTRKKDKKKTPEETLIETANKMLNECEQGSSIIHWHEVTSAEPAVFSQSIRGLSDRLEKFSPETLGEIVGLGISDGGDTGWRSMSMYKMHPSRVLEMDAVLSGRILLERLAWLVIAAAMYDILATQYIIRIERGSTPRSTTYIPPRFLRKYVLRVRRTRL